MTSCTSDPVQTEAQPLPEPPVPLAKPLSVRIVGLGGAGGNALSHIATSDLRDLRLVALHTSARILNLTQVPERLLLGSGLLHGLGAGGDASLARAAAERDMALLKELCQGVDLLFMVAGLGGGTGTGAAPVLARVAKDCGCLVLGVVTLPFGFEGARRRHQASRGLQELKAAADAVICLSNQKILQVLNDKATVLEGLDKTNRLLAQGIRGIWQMLRQPSLIHVDFADLCAVLRDHHAESAFASAEAQGEGRTQNALDQILSCPLLERGQALASADAVLVSVQGGPDLSMADIQEVMDQINRRTEDAKVIVGASVADNLQDRIGVTVITSRRASLETCELSAPDPLEPEPEATVPVLSDFENQCLDPAGPDSSRLPASRPCSNRGPVRKLHSGDAASTGRPPARFQQTHFRFDSISKGRFDKAHPTIYRGEDLDVPTYVRRGIPLN